MHGHMVCTIITTTTTATVRSFIWYTRSRSRPSSV